MKFIGEGTSSLCSHPVEFVGLEIEGTGSRSTENGGGAHESGPVPGNGLKSGGFSARSRFGGSTGGGHIRSLSAENGKSFIPGIPKRDEETELKIERFFSDHGATKAIHSVLIANNGNAATKFIRSVRTWAQVCVRRFPRTGLLIFYSVTMIDFPSFSYFFRM